MKKILFYFSFAAMVLCICGKSQAQKTTLLCLVEKDTVMSEDAKKIFKMLNIKEANWGDDIVEVNEPYFSGRENGFQAPYTIKSKDGYAKMEDGLHTQFRIYKTDDGKYLVVYADLLEDPIRFWSYDNGTLTPLPKYQLPVPTRGKKSKKNNYCTLFLPYGYEIQYDDMSAEVYNWNGKEFVLQK